MFSSISSVRGFSGGSIVARCACIGLGLHVVFNGVSGVERLVEAVMMPLQCVAVHVWVVTGE